MRPSCSETRNLELSNTDFTVSSTHFIGSPTIVAESQISARYGIYSSVIAST